MSSLAETLKTPGAMVECDDDPEAVFDFLCSKGWSDGLPVIPPTPERVERMLAYCDRDFDKPVVRIPPRFGAATPIRVAANAVMAGCKPEYFPLVLLALEALAEEPYNLYGTQATTHPCTPMLIFNGPVAAEVGINSGHNAMGNYVRANAVIGRAVRLALVNIGAAIPGTGDMATAGTPAKFTFCVAENEAASPWEPLHVERGFPADASTVTVVGAECPHNVNDHESLTAEGILTTFAGTMLNAGTNDVCYEAQPVAVFGPEHARTVAQDGYAKADVKRFLQEHAQLPLGRFSKENIERRLRVKLKERYATASLDALVPMVQRAEDIIIVVIGGAGKHSAFIPTFGATQSVTRALKRRDGEYARSVEELRCG